jgi:hypothetical protein
VTSRLEGVANDAFLAQAEMLAQLAEHPGWPAFLDLLRAMRAGTLEELATADADNFRYWQGAANAIGEVIDRPARIVAQADEFLSAEQADTGQVRPELRAVLGNGFDLDGDF